jgi:hypothetical protein
MAPMPESDVRTPINLKDEHNVQDRRRAAYQGAIFWRRADRLLVISKLALDDAAFAIVADAGAVGSTIQHKKSIVMTLGVSCNRTSAPHER